ncbi:MAG TPA: flavin reductase family protein [Pyrinomonadaceae bacterium]|nr:flavin reductase family protein [Pyrinomonadaceae bacterium]
MPVAPGEFRAALSRFPSGVTVVTSIDSSGTKHGITVTAFSSVSLDPPLVLVCIEKTTGSHEALNETRKFAVNILAGGHDNLSERFSLPVGNKFEGVGLRPGNGGVPLLEEALVAIECSLRDAFDGGDHTIFVGEVDSVAIRDGAPLVYFHGSYHDLIDLDL